MWKTCGKLSGKILQFCVKVEKKHFPFPQFLNFPQFINKVLLTIWTE